MKQTTVARAVIRGMLWGVLLAVIAGLVLVTLRGRARRAAAPPVLSELPDFSLTNRDGRTVARPDLAGRPWVADFIFTRCAGPCPLMTRRMADLGERLPPGVRRVSFTVDPDHDSPAVLDAYASRYGAPDSWLFLTGSREEIWQLSVEGFKLGIAGDASGAGGGAGGTAAPGEADAGLSDDSHEHHSGEHAAPPGAAPPVAAPTAPPDHAGPILHSTRFVLVDGEGRIRGYFDAFEEESLDRLVEEARALVGG